MNIEDIENVRLTPEQEADFLRFDKQTKSFTLALTEVLKAALEAEDVDLDSAGAAMCNLGNKLLATKCAASRFSDEHTAKAIKGLQVTNERTFMMAFEDAKRVLEAGRDDD